MNTPAHAVLNLLVLGRPGQAAATGAVAVGALLPDAPMLFFYAVEKLRGVPEAVIWSEHYFAQGWQDFFDVFNSFPLIGLGLLAAGLAHRPVLALFFSSMLLHGLCDLAVHVDDAHRHLWPLSEWRFESPVSYWDPRFYGRTFGMLELALVGMGSVALWWRHPERGVRIGVASIAVLYVSFIAYAIVVWL